MGASLGAGEIELLDQKPVRDNLIVARGGDDELAGGLVVGMVHHRQPLPGAVRPVLAEAGPLAMNVRDQTQSVARDTAVFDRNLNLLATGRRRREWDTQ